MATKGKRAAATKNAGCCGAECCEGAGCCSLPSAGCCQVEAVVGVDARGQMVLPKELRQKFGIRPDDKLAVVVWRRGEVPCCLTLHPVGELATAVREAYGPILREVVRDRGARAGP